MNRNLYLFDFDGTLTTKDSLFDFLKFSFPKHYKKHFIFFLPLFILAKVKLAEPSKVKEKFISSFLKGKSYHEIQNLANQYFQHNFPILIHPKADEYINSVSNYHDKFIVSASLDLWLQPFANHYGMGLICTEGEFDDQGYYTGKFSTENCNNKQKKIRIEKEVDLMLYDEVLAFGDTSGDLAMFELATKSYFKHFN